MSLTARDALSDKLIRVEGEARLRDVMSEIQARGASHVAVFDLGRFRGIVRLLETLHVGPHRIFADLIRTPAVPAVRVDTPLEEVGLSIHRGGAAAAVVLDASDEFVGIVTYASLFEATSAERQQQLLIQAESAEQRFRNVVAYAAEAIVVIDQRGVVHTFNRAAEEMFRYRADDVLGRNVSILMPAPHCELHDTYIQQYLATRIPRIIGRRREEVGLRSDGTTFPMELHVSEVRDGEDLLFCGIVTDIRERVRATEALRQSVERYRLLFEQNLAGVLRSTLEGRCLDCNEAFVRMFGYASKQELLAHPVVDLYPTPAHRERFLAALRQGRELKNHEVELRRKDGSPLWGLVNAGLISDAEGGEFIQGTIIDVTERKRAEEEVQARVRQQAAVADLGRAALAGADMDALCDQACRQVAEVLDVDYAKVLELLPDLRRLLLRSGVGWRGGLVGEATVDAGVYSQAGFTLSSSMPVIVEDLRTETRFHGPPLLLEHGVGSGVSVVIQGPDRPYGVLGAHTSRQRRFTDEDINFLQAVANVLAEAHRSRRAEEGLRAAENRYRAIFEHTPCPILAIDPADGSFLDFNEAAHRSLGYTRAEFAHLTIPDIESRETADDVASHIQRLMETGGDEFETELKTKTGEIRDFFVRVRRLELGGRAYLQSVALDITERRRAEEEARRHQAELAHVARVSTVGEMASGLAHELNQPLTAVVNFAEGALRRLRSDTSVHADILEAIEMASSQAHRAAEIIRRLSSFVQKREPRRSTCNLNEAVREVVSFLSADARDQGALIRLDLSIDLPAVLADTIQIQQVVLNLVRNGIEAMSETRAEDRILEIRTSSVGNGVEVAVRDRGPGLTSEVQERIFTPFYTTKPRGMGMGLSISRSIIDAHCGRLWAAPNPEGGATFQFTLPVSDPPASPLTKGGKRGFR